MKLTQKDFSLFKKEANKIIKRLNLFDWSFEFRFVPQMEECPSCGMAVAECNAKVATIFLFNDWGEEETVTDNKVKATAFHEVQHVALAEMNLYIRRLEVAEYGDGI